MTRQAVDLTGRNFGHWTIISREGSSPTTLQARWRARCACGIEEVKDGWDWRKCTEHSACLACRKKIVSEMNRRHGETGSYLHTLWLNMRRRCSETTRSGYKNYGGRGIRVHARWAESYEAFAAYVRRYLGERPTPAHSLDRKNNNGNYEPGNLRWATPKEQNQNKRPYQKRLPPTNRALTLHNRST